MNEKTRRQIQEIEARQERRRQELLDLQLRARWDYRNRPIFPLTDRNS